MSHIKSFALLLSLLVLITGCEQKNVDWSSYGNNLENQRYSKLNQINQHNVNNLKLAWQYQTGIKASFQSTPLVHEGIMYVSLPFNHVIALNAKTGKEIWRYEHDR
ncbi:MAG: PQQ-binding-like beta-propeller repeat protein, partial [Methylophilales bacterium]|nr:PQQ-binding-like beta-propeller repeat protein [Methylophilales bacterium]